MNKISPKVILSLILLLAGFLRIWKLSDYPVGFHIDEASLGYNAYSLLKTGRDENGKYLPLHIDMFGDSRPAGYQYLDILPIKIFGFNEFATRLPSATFGVLSILAIYLLVKKLFANKSMALIAGFLLTISPWHLVTSRASAETVVALFLIIFGAYYFLDNRLFKVIVFWGFSLFFYHSSRVFVPLLAMTMILLKKKRRCQDWIILLVIIVMSLYLVFGNSAGTGRFKQVSIFHFPEIRLVLEEQITEDGRLFAPILLTRVFHNKIINYGLGFLREYFSYFSLNFLFIEGGLPVWYQIPNMGLFYLWELPFLIAGLYLLVRDGIKSRYYWLPIIWLLIAPLTAALTRDDVPNIQRALVMLPALLIIISYGISQTVVWFKKNLDRRLLLVGFVVLILFGGWNFGYFLHQYFIHTKIHRPWFRFYGFKEMVLKVNELAPNYEKIFVSKTEGGIYMHFLFFGNIDPRQYQNWGSPKDKDNAGFGKYIFVSKDCPDIVPNSLMVASGKCDEMPFTSEYALPIYRPDGTVAFIIYAKNSDEE